MSDALTFNGLAKLRPNLGPDRRDVEIATLKADIVKMAALLREGAEIARETTAEMKVLRAGVAAMRAALIHHYDQEWDIGDGISDDEKVKFLIAQVPE